MKRVKFMLTAIAVFAVVGGALAFKAIKTNKFMYTSIGGKCPAYTTTNFQSTPIVGVTPTTQLYFTNDADTESPCPVTALSDAYPTTD